MNPLMYVPNKTPGKFRVGDRVRLCHGGFRSMIAEVIEDRGRIGVGGRQLYTVKLRIDEWNEFNLERPEESLEAVEESSAAPGDGDKGNKGKAVGSSE